MNGRDVSLTGIPHMGKATVVGAFIGAVAVAVPVSLALMLLGVGPVGVLAAAHVAFFGGMGYGGMLGAVIQADRYERTGLREALAGTRVVLVDGPHYVRERSSAQSHG